jgi:hypothetical protein
MNKKAWLGILVAPLAAPVLYQIGLILFEYKTVGDIKTLVNQAFIPLLAIALPISYGAMLLIGLPLIWILKRIDYLNFFTLTFGALIFGALIMAYIYGPQSWTNVGLKDYLWYPIYGGFLGFSVAAVYCLITGITVGYKS